MIVNGSDASTPSEEVFELHRKGGVGCVVLNGWGAGTLADYEALDPLFADGRQRLVKSYADIEAAGRGGQVAVVLGLQHADAFTTAAGVDWGFCHAEPQLRLEEHHARGLRSVNFCYNLANQFGGGCLDAEAGLTLSGRYLQDALQEMGMLVDCGGHTGRRTTLDIIDRARQPVICSHANIFALNANSRCLQDDVISAIAATGGVIGITASDDLMQRNAATAGQELPHCSLARMADEFDYVRDLAGVDHVGVGPDFVHGKTMPDGLGRSLIFPPEMVMPQEELRFAEGFEDASEFPNLAAELRRRGWSEAEVDKAMGGNWLRVFQAVWR